MNERKSAAEGRGRSERRASSHRGPKNDWLNAAGEERPMFIQQFPDDGQLRQLCDLFEEGNFRELRRQVPKFLASTRDERLARAALELKSRTEPDPILVWMLAACFALFAFVVGWIYIR